MKLTIGMASYNNFDQVWFTVQALRLYQDLTDAEILVIDNFGDDNLKNFIEGWCHPHARYIRYTDKQGTAAPRQKVFEEAQGEWVICMDSHVMFPPGVIKRFREWSDAHPYIKDLIQGPMLYDDLHNMADAMEPQWRGHMWGTWRGAGCQDGGDLYEIPMHGMGFWACRKDSWLGFHPDFKGFGGEEGYIHEKYRKAGKKTWCAPWLKWLHKFTTPGRIPYNPTVEDRVHNYKIGFDELGLNHGPINLHFNSYPAPISGKISCVMITFRRMHCVERSISLWLQQTHYNSELIIYNTDIEHPVILGESLQGYDIKVINNNSDYITGKDYTNVGAIRRDSLAQATGEYYICWDDDDIFLPWNNKQCFDGINGADLWAWKPEYSMWKSGGVIKYAKNSMEASVISRVVKIRELGFQEHLGGGEHLQWMDACRNAGKILEDPKGIPAYSFNWSDPPEIAGHKQSGTIDHEDNFNLHKKGCTDIHTRPLEAIDVSSVIEEYFEFMKTNDLLGSNFASIFTPKE
jgi:hypothetical protein